MTSFDDTSADIKTKSVDVLEHIWAIFSWFKIMVITSADFVWISADVILKMTIILNWGLRNCVLKMEGPWILDTYLFEKGLILWRYYYSTAICSAIQLWKADSRIKFFGPFPLPSMEKSFANSIFQVISLIIFGEISLALASWSIEKFWRLGFLHKSTYCLSLTFQFQCHLYIYVPRTVFF